MFIYFKALINLNKIITSDSLGIKTTCWMLILWVNIFHKRFFVWTDSDLKIENSVLAVLLATILLLYYPHRISKWKFLAPCFRLQTYFSNTIRVVETGRMSQNIEKWEVVWSWLRHETFIRLTFGKRLIKHDHQICRVRWNCWLLIEEEDVMKL